MTLEERFAKDAAMLAGLGINCLVDADSAGGVNSWRLELPVTSVRVNAAGFCHGGYLFALADTACAYALAEAGHRPATIDANITYLKAARLHDLIVTRIEVLHIGRALGVADVQLLRAKDHQLLAVYRGSCAVSR